MSWLNFNDSLNNIKGQISSFASNVLADEIRENTDVGDLQRVCTNQQEEITNLKKLVEKLSKERKLNQVSNHDQSDSNWTWESPDASCEEKIRAQDVVSNLTAKISELENEKRELVMNMDLLDSDFQQNTEKLVSIKDKLQADYNELEDKYVKVRDNNKILENNSKKEKTELEELKVKCEELSTKASTRDVEEPCAKCEELMKQMEKLQTEIKTLNENVLKDRKSGDDLKQLEDNLKLAESENKILVQELQKATTEVVDFKLKSQTDTENFSKLAMILEGYEQQVSTLKEELAAKTVSAEKAPSDEELIRLNEDIENLQKTLKISSAEKDKTHNKYISILTENVKKYADCRNSSDFQSCPKDDDPKLAEFCHQVENIMKILLDSKFKCENLETDLYNIKQEKTNLLTEKNHEIEKLLQNSEILSQEVITKSQTIRDYEIEINELIKNNDILISELEQHKNNSGLQTISESNEDNLLLLESQLENANKRIEHLENEVAKYEDNAEVELNKEMENLNLTYNPEDFENLKLENTSLKDSIRQLEQNREEIKDENEDLNSSLEKLKADLENAEYQYTESNINLESLREEVEGQRKKVEEVITQKNSFEKFNMEYERINADIRGEINELREKLLFEEDTRKQFENQIHHLTEKLQNAKMCETSLKLQCDTGNKELAAATEAKSMLEISLKNILADFKQCQDNFIVLQQENAELGKLLGNYENKVKDYEQEIARRDEIIGRLNVMEKEYENLAIEESGELLNKLHLTTDDGSFKENMEVETNVSLITNNFETISLNQSEDDQSILNKNLEKLQEELHVVTEERNSLQSQISKLISIYNEHAQCLQKFAVLEKNISEMTASKNELTNVVIKKHQENVAYHNEIQRLTQILNGELEKSRNLEIRLQSTLNESEITKKNEELEKLTDQNGFLREKCEVLAESLLQEQSKLQQTLAEHAQPSEKEQALNKKLERLQSHLIELEEHYTHELLRAEEKNTELQAKVNEIEQREKSSSTMYTSVSIRANQHVETLQHQLQLITSQRDELRKKVSDMEDHMNKQAASLANLQFVLEQFQTDKDKDVQKETERIRRQVIAERKVQDDLKGEISNLQLQLAESKQGLLAAARLSDQLEQSKQTVSALKLEVSQLKEKLGQNEEQLKAVASQTDGKVDKSLIKNLIIGFVTTNYNLNKDQSQILKIIATVLDFNQQDHDKINLNKPQQGWLGSLLTPQTSQGMSQESLSQAFVKFLENESKPRVVQSLLHNADEAPKSRKSSTATAPRQSPIVLSEVVLPTFADFAQNRNSSSILKDVLKDNNQ